MKKYILINSIILFIIISAFTACDSSQEKTEYHIRNNSNNKQLLKAIVPTNLFVREELVSSISVLEARKRNIIGELLTVEGYIGSRKDPSLKIVLALSYVTTPSILVTESWVIIVQHRGCML